MNLVADYLDPAYDCNIGSVYRLLSVCKDWNAVLGRRFTRPSLCFFPAVDLVSPVAVEEQDSSSADLLSTGPETSFKTWKHNRAVNSARRRVANLEEAEPQPEASVEMVAELFGVEPADLAEVLGENTRFLPRLMKVNHVNATPDPQRDGLLSRANQRDASHDLFPTPNAIATTEAPLFPSFTPFVHPRGLTTFLLEDIIPDPGVLAKFASYMTRLTKDLVKGAEMATLGRAYTPRVNTPFIIGPESFAPWAVGHHFDTKDPAACFHVSMDDPWENPLLYHEVAAELGGEAWPDQAFCMLANMACLTSLTYSLVCRTLWWFVLRINRLDHFFLNWHKSLKRQRLQVGVRVHLFFRAFPTIPIRTVLLFILIELQ